ncbi:hypothetical protein LAZ39_18150 [Cereibacter sphaeroides]|nr:hypothetical protein [Cereibacter sphaeroides]
MSPVRFWPWAPVSCSKVTRGDPTFIHTFRTHGTPSTGSYVIDAVSDPQREGSFLRGIWKRSSEGGERILIGAFGSPTAARKICGWLNGGEMTEARARELGRAAAAARRGVRLH